MADSYLRFNEYDSASGKTKIVNVYSARSGDKLGEIRWFGRWRQYAFFPGEGTIWNPECMKEICEKISTLMKERR